MSFYEIPTQFLNSLVERGNLFSDSAAAQKGVKTTIEKSGSSLDLGPFSVQLARLDSMDHFELTTAK